MTPYDQGRAAFAAGKGLADNPYPCPHPGEDAQRWEWNRGWKEAWKTKIDADQSWAESVQRREEREAAKREGKE